MGEARPAAKRSSKLTTLTGSSRPSKRARIAAQRLLQPIALLQRISPLLSSSQPAQNASIAGHSKGERLVVVDLSVSVHTRRVDVERRKSQGAQQVVGWQLTDYTKEVGATEAARAA